MRMPFSTHDTPTLDHENIDRIFRERFLVAAEVWGFDPRRKTFVYSHTTGLQKAMKSVAESNQGLTTERSLYGWTWFYLA